MKNTNLTLKEIEKAIKKVLSSKNSLSNNTSTKSIKPVQHDKFLWKLALKTTSYLKKRGKLKLSNFLFKISSKIIRTKHYYLLKDFLKEHDKNFLYWVYKCILNRDIDEAGEIHYLQQLRNGSRTKIEIIKDIRFSAEGKSFNVQIKGLVAGIAFIKLSKIPILGGSLIFIRNIFLVNRQEKKLRELEIQLYASESTTMEYIESQFNMLIAELSKKAKHK